MFETFVWIIGEEPFLRLNRFDPDRVIEMDVVGKSCMQYESVITPKQNRLDVKVMTFQGEHDFKLKSKTCITVADFVEIVNNKMAEVMDVKTNDLVVTKSFIKDCTIILFTHLDTARH